MKVLVVCIPQAGHWNPMTPLVSALLAPGFAEPSYLRAARVVASEIAAMSSAGALAARLRTL